MLTEKQRTLLVFIHDCLNERGVSPSFDEMKDALGLKSKSGIHRLITALEERGFLKRLPHRARALEVTRLPDNMQMQQTSGQSTICGLIEGKRTPRRRPAPGPAVAGKRNLRSDALSLRIRGQGIER